MPIKKYLEAVSMYREGKKDQAAQLLAESLGVSKPSPVITNFIDKLLEQNTMANNAILKILSTEVSKRRDG